jgi:hypothetical protein
VTVGHVQPRDDHVLGYRTGVIERVGSLAKPEAPHAMQRPGVGAVIDPRLLGPTHSDAVARERTAGGDRASRHRQSQNHSCRDSKTCLHQSSRLEGCTAYCRFASASGRLNGGRAGSRLGLDRALSLVDQRGSQRLLARRVSSSMSDAVARQGQRRALRTDAPLLPVPHDDGPYAASRSIRVIQASDHRSDLEVRHTPLS